jgi:hypothetical protein
MGRIPCHSLKACNPLPLLYGKRLSRPPHGGSAPNVLARNCLGAVWPLWQSFCAVTGVQGRWRRTRPREAQSAGWSPLPRGCAATRCAPRPRSPWRHAAPVWQRRRASGAGSPRCAGPSSAEGSHANKGAPRACAGHAARPAGAGGLAHGEAAAGRRALPGPGCVGHASGDDALVWPGAAGCTRRRDRRAARGAQRDEERGPGTPGPRRGEDRSRGYRWGRLAGVGRAGAGAPAGRGGQRASGALGGPPSRRQARGHGVPRGPGGLLTAVGARPLAARTVRVAGQNGLAKGQGPVPRGAGACAGGGEVHRARCRCPTLVCSLWLHRTIR